MKKLRVNIRLPPWNTKPFDKYGSQVFYRFVFNPSTSKVQEAHYLNEKEVNYYKQMN